MFSANLYHNDQKSPAELLLDFLINQCNTDDDRNMAVKLLIGKTAGGVDTVTQALEIQVQKPEYIDYRRERSRLSTELSSVTLAEDRKFSEQHPFSSEIPTYSRGVQRQVVQLQQALAELDKKNRSTISIHAALSNGLHQYKFQRLCDAEKVKKAEAVAQWEAALLRFGN